MKKLGFVSIIFLSCIACSKKIAKPNFINFSLKKDSIYVIAKNTHPFPLSAKIIENKTNNIKQIELKTNSDSIILRYSKKDTDTVTILKTYTFKGYYGNLSVNSYDTAYNYTLPFVKNYTSKIIQGYDGSFTHFGDESSKTIDFDMAIGDTIVASRDGVVAAVLAKHNKQGITKDYRKYGNYIVLYHKDNTYSQYVHIKQFGNLVDVGDSVKANQPIALSGFTGWTTLPHLHFGVYIPTKNGFKSVPIILDSIPARTLKKGDIIQKK